MRDSRKYRHNILCYAIALLFLNANFILITYEPKPLFFRGYSLCDTPPMVSSSQPDQGGATMCKNKIQFQQGLSLQSFLSQFGSEDQCRNALVRWRWPQGFVCPSCGHTKSCLLKTRDLFQCNRCRAQISITAGTIFDSTNLSTANIYRQTMPTGEVKNMTAYEEEVLPGKSLSSRQYP